MANVHHASLFDYNSFINEIEPIVEQVDLKQYKSLQDLAYQTILQFQKKWPLCNHGLVDYEGGVRKEVLTQEWPLYAHGGGSLSQPNEIISSSNPRSVDLGYWLLIILAKHLQLCSSPHGNWSVPSAALNLIGWSNEDAKVLFQGKPTYKLIKPNLTSCEPLNSSSPYWCWLHPWQARSGWLTFEEIDRLFPLLDRAKDQIINFDVRHIPNINISNPVVLRDYKIYLQDGYQGTITMLKEAMESKLGLFMSITTWA